MFHLDEYLPKNFKFITQENWDKTSRKGWRFLVNIWVMDLRSAVRRLEEAQDEFGFKSVTIGFPWREDIYKPDDNAHRRVLGIYVRDVDDQISELRSLLDQPVEEWVTIDG